MQKVSFKMGNFTSKGLKFQNSFMAARDTEETKSSVTFLFKTKSYTPAGVALPGTEHPLASDPKGCRFCFQSGHMAGL